MLKPSRFQPNPARVRSTLHHLHSYPTSQTQGVSARETSKESNTAIHQASVSTPTFRRIATNNSSESKSHRGTFAQIPARVHASEKKTVRAMTRAAAAPAAQGNCARHVCLLTATVAAAEPPSLPGRGARLHWTTSATGGSTCTWPRYCSSSVLMSCSTSRMQPMLQACAWQLKWQ